MSLEFVELRGNSVTSAALMVLANNAGISPITVLEDLSDYLAIEDKRSRSFATQVNQPVQVTVKSPKGYSKRPLIGGEFMTLNGAYHGKRDGVIIVARSVNGEHFEFPAKVAEEVLDGYEEVIKEYIDYYGLENDWGDAKLAQKNAEDLERIAHEKAMLEIREKDERFGSW